MSYFISFSLQNIYIFIFELYFVCVKNFTMPVLLPQIFIVSKRNLPSFLFNLKTLFYILIFQEENFNLKLF